MAYPINSHDQRRDPRYALQLPAQISVGSQFVLQGRLRDLSLNSAFILMKTGSVYFKTNDEVGFAIHSSSEIGADLIEGLACISRIVSGEGLAIYFTKMDKNSTLRLRELLKQ
ncbi:MAG: PilZ domain-containing protein [Candidatus Omnitrophica bacterium]|nr:PilZ domain-containing protein [Candidatus Omnitrophota bacterium]